MGKEGKVGNGGNLVMGVSAGMLALRGCHVQVRCRGDELFSREVVVALVGKEWGTRCVGGNEVCLKSVCVSGA